MRKYWGIFKNYFISSLEYRSNLIGVVLKELVAMGVVLVLWLAIYKQRSDIGGFQREETIAYYILVPLVGFITSATLSQKLGREIKDGFLSAKLLKPFIVWVGEFISSLAHKAFSLITLFPLYVIMLGLLLHVLNTNIVTFSHLATGIGIAFFGYLLHLTFDLAISFLTFWTDDVWAFSHIKKILFGIFGGLSFPFAFLPDSLEKMFNLLPFRFMYYVPVQYMLGQKDASYLPSDFIALFVWMCIFALVASLLWRKGLRKYGAYGN